MTAYVRVGDLRHYDLLSDRLEFRVDILADALPPGDYPHLSFTLNEGTDLDQTDSWCGLARSACKAYIAQTWVSSKSARIKETAALLADEDSALGLELDEAWANDRLQAADEMEARAGVIRKQAQSCLDGIAARTAKAIEQMPARSRGPIYDWCKRLLANPDHAKAATDWLVQRDAEVARAAVEAALSVERIAEVHYARFQAKQHGQLCPVWTHRLWTGKNSKRPIPTMADCTCWQAPDARRFAASFRDALLSPTPDSTEAQNHE